MRVLSGAQVTERLRFKHPRRQRGRSKKLRENSSAAAAAQHGVAQQQYGKAPDQVAEADPLSATKWRRSYPDVRARDRSPSWRQVVVEPCWSARGRSRSVALGQSHFVPSLVSSRILDPKRGAIVGRSSHRLHAKPCVRAGGDAGNNCRVTTTAPPCRLSQDSKAYPSGQPIGFARQWRR